MGNCIKCNARRPHSGSTYSSRSWRSRFQSISNGGTEQKIMSAQYSYEGSDEGELSFEKGDQMVIIDDKEPDWWLAKRYNSETTGYIPMSYVVMNMIETEDKTSRRLAEKLLLLDAYPRGTFLRRLPSIPNYEATNGTNGPKQKIVIALYSYEGRGEGELRFEKGDKLVIIDDTDGKWWLAKGLTSETTGYIPMNFVINETT
ncbi:unnamed protein product, partial [Medioppia subpectinata]